MNDNDFHSPTDEELRYIGFNDRQMDLLDGVDDNTRQVVYEEQIRLLMERSSDYDHLSDEFLP